MGGRRRALLGEVTKTGRLLAMANSDHRLLNVHVSWVRAYLRDEPLFVLSLNLHAGNDEPAARQFWHRALDIDHPQFTKTFIKPDGTGHRKNHLAHGVCRVRMRFSTDAWIRTMTWIDSIGKHL